MPWGELKGYDTLSGGVRAKERRFRGVIRLSRRGKVDEQEGPRRGPTMNVRRLCEAMPEATTRVLAEPAALVS